MVIINVPDVVEPMDVTKTSMQKKKVAVLITAITGGGAERVLATLLHELENEFDFHLVLLHNHILYKLPEGQKIFFLNSSPDAEKGIMKVLSLPLYAMRYAKFCRKYNIETSISFLFRSHHVNAMSKSFGNKARIIISERTNASEYIRSLGKISGRIQKLLLKRYYPKADLIIPNSLLSAIDLKENFGIKTQMQVIRNPVNIAEIQQQAAEPLDITDHQFTFIHVAAMRREKNYELLLNAFKTLEDLDCRLVILGRGAMEKFISEKISSSRVILPGHDLNPYKYLSRADCFVLCSDFEGFPNVILEALACSLPVISTDCRSGPREILAPDTEIRKQITGDIEIAPYGILTPVNDVDQLSKAMRLMFENHELRKDYRSKALNRANDFGLDTFIDAFRKVF